MPDEDLVYVKGNCHVRHGDRVLNLRRGAAWEADDPLVKERPWLFTEAPERVHSTTEAPVERGTRAPGERRTAVKRAPKGGAGG